jgi:hypothetical protein
MSLLPIFNNTSEMKDKQKEDATQINLWYEYPTKRLNSSSYYLKANRSNLSSIDILRNIYDDIMTPINQTADPRISKFSASFYLKPMDNTLEPALTEV